MAEQPLQVPNAPEARKDSSGYHPRVQRQDLRKHLRFRVDDASAAMYVQGFLTSIGLGRVNKARAAINLSEGGTLLLARDRIPPGTKVLVRIEMERFEDVIEVEGVVCWCGQSGKNDKDYYAGIEFNNLTPSDAKKIANMREWFTSPECKTRSATRRRTKSGGIQTDV